MYKIINIDGVFSEDFGSNTPSEAAFTKARELLALKFNELPGELVQVLSYHVHTWEDRYGDGRVIKNYMARAAVLVRKATKKKKL